MMRSAVPFPPSWDVRALVTIASGMTAVSALEVSAIDRSNPTTFWKRLTTRSTNRGRSQKVRVRKTRSRSISTVAMFASVMVVGRAGRIHHPIGVMTAGGRARRLRHDARRGASSAGVAAALRPAPAAGRPRGRDRGDRADRAQGPWLRGDRRRAAAERAVRGRRRRDRLRAVLHLAPDLDRAELLARRGGGRRGRRRRPRGRRGGGARRG